MKYTMLALLVVHISASAQVYKCTDAAGRVTYTNQDCVKQETRRSLTAESQAASPWALISMSSTEEFWGEDSSLQVNKTPTGIAIVSIVGKRVDRALRTVQIEQWYVPIADCQAQRGRIVTTTPDGNKYIRHYDFIFGVGTVQAINAQAICEAYTLRQSNQNR